MRLESELKGERMVTPGIQTGPRIVHIDRGSSQQWSVILDADTWTPFVIDAKGGEMKTKGEHAHKGEHELLSSMTKGEIVDWIVIDANMGLAVAP